MSQELLILLFGIAISALQVAGLFILNDLAGRIRRLESVYISDSYAGVERRMRRVREE